jgi:Xaa-Pro aminopeptidase
MVVSVESYIGEKSGSEGVKLEEEVLVTDNSPVLISRFPFEEDLIQAQA